MNLKNKVINLNIYIYIYIYLELEYTKLKINIKSCSSNRDLITVSLPIGDKLLERQQFKICWIWVNLGIKFNSHNAFTFKDKLIPSVLKVLSFHTKPSLLKGLNALPFNLPIWIASDLDIFILQPENVAKSLRVSNKFSNESKSPCRKQVVLSAKRLIFFSTPPILMPIILSLFPIEIASTSTAQRNKRGEIGQPWKMPRSNEIPSVRNPLLLT